MTDSADVQEQPKKKSSGPGCLIIALVVGFFGIAIIGVLAAIAIPNFIKFQSRAKQSEAKVNLKGIFTAQRAHFAETDGYAATFKQAGFHAFDITHYDYYLGDDVLTGRSTRGTALPSAVSVAVTSEGFVAAAVGNVDGDPGLDVWTINQDNQLVNVVNDLEN